MIKRFLSFVLIALLALSPIQVALSAISPMGMSDQHGQNCELSAAQMADMALDNNTCHLEHDKDCANHPECIGHISVNNLNNSNSFSISPRYANKSAFNHYQDALQTRYPLLLKRPPKV